MTNEFESMSDTLNLNEVRDYGTFKVVRVGPLRFIPNYDGNYGRALRDLSLVTMDKEDIPLSTQVNTKNLSDTSSIKDMLYSLRYVNQAHITLCSSAGNYYSIGIWAISNYTSSNNNYLCNNPFKYGSTSIMNFTKYATNGEWETIDSAAEGMNYLGGILYVVP